MMNRSNIFLMLIAFQILFVTHAWSSTTVSITGEQLCEQAKKIVYGKFTGSESVKIDRKIYTKMSFEVERTVKGEPASTITIVKLGGSGGKNSPVSVNTSVSILPKGKAILFLEDSAAFAGAYELSNLFNGVVMISDAGKTRLNNLFSTAGVPASTVLNQIETALAREPDGTI